MLQFEDIKNNVIVETFTGSYLYGTQTNDSDKDYVGIFIPPIDYILGLKSVKEIDASIKSKDENNKNTKSATDKKFYEFRHFVNLAIQNNPNILEILFTNEKSIQNITMLGDFFLKNKHLFPSKRGMARFLGFINSQRRKIFIKPDKLKELKKGYEILIRQNENKTIGEIRNKFVEHDKKHIDIGDLYFESGTYVGRALKIVKNRLDKFTNRKILLEKYGYDTKYASHLIRLLHEGIELVQEHHITFPLKRRKQIIDIKKGKFKLKELVDYSYELEKKLKNAIEISTLEAEPDYEGIEKLVIFIMKYFLEKNN